MTLWVTFDCYGTLVDWVHGIRSVLEYLTGDTGSITRFFGCEKESIQGFRLYSEVLKKCTRRVLEEYGVEYRDEYGEAVVAGFAHSPLFPDTVPGLLALKRLGVKTAVISNTERRLIGATLAGLESLFDKIVTAEDTGAYKPSLEAFKKAYELIGAEPSIVVHVSAYPYYDLEPASRLGARTVLVNRYGYEWPVKVKSIEGVAEIVKSLLAVQG